MTLVPSRHQIDNYARGKHWYWYMPFWLVCGYIFVKLLGFDPNGQLPLIIAIPQAFDFFLHEMAHIVTAFLPPILTASAGSLSEILLGSLLVRFAFKSRSYMVAMLCCLWFMLACQSAGTYMADARAQKLSLVSLGGILSGSDSAQHDWHFVFGQLHILNLDILIGDTVRAIGIVVGVLGLALGAYTVYRMASLKPETK